MKYSSNYSKFLGTVIDKSSLQKDEKEEIKEQLEGKLIAHDKELERSFNLRTKKWLAIMIASLYGFSYLVLILALVSTFIFEAGLVKSGTLEANNRTINSKVIIVLIGGTIAQTATSFIALTQYFFRTNP